MSEFPPIHESAPPAEYYDRAKKVFVVGGWDELEKELGFKPKLEQGSRFTYNGEEYEVLYAGVSFVQYINRYGSAEPGPVIFELWVATRCSLGILFDFPCFEEFMRKKLPKFHRPYEVRLPSLQVRHISSEEMHNIKYPEEDSIQLITDSSVH